MALDLLSSMSVDMQSATPCSPSLQALYAVVCVDYPFGAELFGLEVIGLGLLREDLEIATAVRPFDTAPAADIAVDGDLVLEIALFGDYLIVFSF